ncbi:DUF3558 domain-containing protein [Amycolatopsis sp. NPDC051071]|uniref:DUF3558 domain-containing protein n=1 Tax=Amycolatopsis sp. NPDC051071 TaxID=3154637 RepID=UPI00342A8179
MTNRSISVKLAMAGVLFATVASCSSEVPGLPSATPSSPGAASPTQKAPSVRQPLNADKFLTAPCTSLDQAQLDKLNSQGTGKPAILNGDPNCSWEFGPNGDTGAGLTYVSSVKNGLSNLYALDETGWWKNGYFEPTAVNEYPAAYNELVDNRVKGDCVLSVAITDALFFTVSVRARAGNDVCTAAKNVASDVIDTIKKGA